MKSIFQVDVEQELVKARKLHPGKMPSLHHAYAVIAEEVDELWELVRMKAKHRDQDKVHQELVQIAAMCQRAAEDLYYG